MGICENGLKIVTSELFKCKEKESVLQIGVLSFQVPFISVAKNLESFGVCKIVDNTVYFKDSTKIKKILKDKGLFRINKISQNKFFDPDIILLSLGFGDIHALDISNYDGADIIGDLNDPDLHNRIGTKFGTIVELGTLEHIFHLPNALWNIAQMCQVGGEVIHGAPTNNWPNHGFYQLSPTLFHDYYKSNGFEVIESWFLRIPVNPNGIITRIPYNYTPSFRDPIPLDGHRYNFWIRVRKIENRHEAVFPQQGAYNALEGWKSAKVN